LTVIDDILEVTKGLFSLFVSDLFLETINKLLVIALKLWTAESKSSGVDGAIRVGEGDGVVGGPVLCISLVSGAKIFTPANKPLTSCLSSDISNSNEEGSLAGGSIACKEFSLALTSNIGGVSIPKSLE
jgi:hypothetical protein